MSINEQQAKLLILEVLTSEFKASKKDMPRIASTILEKVLSLQDTSNRNINTFASKIRPDHATVGHAVMTEGQSAKNDDISKAHWEKKKLENSFEVIKKSDQA